MRCVPGTRSSDRSGDFDLELFRLDVEGEFEDVLVSAQYRFYASAGFDTLHHAWVGYDFLHGRTKLGIVQVPFGLLPYASHCWWFGIGYYLGLEDDYDAGVVWESRGEGPHEVQLAFFKQQELGSDELERYSFDVVRGGDDGGDAAQQNEESNQLNARWTYRRPSDRAGASSPACPCSTVGSTTEPRVNTAITGRRRWRPIPRRPCAAR